MKSLSKIILATSLLTASPSQNTTVNKTTSATKSTVYSLIEKKNENDRQIEHIANKYLIKYKIERWDNIRYIANKFGVSPKELWIIRKITENLDPKRSIDFLIAWDNIFVPESYSKYEEFKENVKEFEEKKKYERNNELYEKGDRETLKKQIDFNIFPRVAQKIWIAEMSKALINNMKYSLNPYNPQLVDVQREDWVNCAGMMRAFYSSSIPEKNRSLEMRRYSEKQNIDAWKLPQEMIKIWFTRTNNLMKYFDHSKIWKKEIVHDKEWYFNELLEIWNKLNNWEITVGSMIPAYFKLSRYKWVVKNHNKNKKIDEKSINTHAMIVLWVWETNFKALEIKNIKNWKVIEIKETLDRDIIKYFIDFVQERGWYNSALSNGTKKTIKERLEVFYPLVKISINWKEINFWEQFKLEKNERIKIWANDEIKIEWAIVWDGFHNVLSKNPEISEENNFRTMFFIEPLLIWTYVFSEVLEQNGLEKEVKETYIDSINEKIEITNLYDLKQWEMLSVKAYEAILRYKFHKLEELKVTTEEIYIIKQIKLKRNNSIKTKLNYKLSSLRKKKINNIIKSLTEEEKIELNREYKRQIKSLQLFWYMQSERKPNIWTTNINAPIPFFNTENTNKLFKEYTTHKVEEFRDIQNGNIDKKFIKVLFLEWFNSTNIYNEIFKLLKVHINQYPDFKLLNKFNYLQKKYLLDKVIDKTSNDEKIDVSNGKFPAEFIKIIWLDEINKVLGEIKNQSFLKKVEVSTLDEAVIKLVVNTSSDEDIIRQILAKESYIRQWHIGTRLILKKLARKIWKVSSFWDFQIRFKNLRTENSLDIWPTKKDILKSINTLNSKEIKDFVERRKARFPDIIKNDEKIIIKIEEQLTYMNERNRVKTWNEIFESLKDIFRFDDGTWTNILWKIIQASLIKSKLDWEMNNLGNWIDKWWASIDDIQYSDELRYVVERIRLEIHNKSEKKVLLWINENYILRILSTIDNISDEKYPKIELNEKRQLIYSKDIIKKHLTSYKKIIENLEFEKEIKDLLLQHISDILEWNLSSNELFELFRDSEIKAYLEKRWESNIFLPSKVELKRWKGTSNFRRMFFWYSSPALNRKPPEIDNWNYLFTYEGKIAFWWLLSLILAWWLKFRKKIKATIQKIKK